MSNGYHCGVLFAALAVSSFGVCSQHALASGLSASDRPQVIEAIVEGLSKDYVFPEMVPPIAEALRKGLAAGRYDQDELGAFADAVTADLRAAGRDRHLRLRVAPQGPAADVPAVREPPDMDRMRMFGAGSNFGMSRLEVLPGNVGVLEVSGFHPVEFAAQRISDAMAFLADTDALIIDLRRNGGGAPETVAFLATYFFPEVPRVTLIELRDRDGRVKEAITTAPMVPGRRYLGRPVYVLTSKKTVSAGEEFAYDLQAHGLAVVVGEVTAGGANPGADQRVHPQFKLFVPTMQAISPKTQGNWEQVGVTPDAEVPAVSALAEAHRRAIDRLLESIDYPPRRAALEQAKSTLASGD